MTARRVVGIFRQISRGHTSPLILRRMIELILRPEFSTRETKEWSGPGPRKIGLRHELVRGVSKWTLLKRRPRSLEDGDYYKNSLFTCENTLLAHCASSGAQRTLWLDDVHRPRIFGIQHISSSFREVRKGIHEERRSPIE